MISKIQMYADISTFKKKITIKIKPINQLSKNNALNAAKHYLKLIPSLL